MKTLLLIAGLMTSIAWAQPTAGQGGPQPPISEVKTYLSLTDAQVQSLQSVQTQLATSTSTVRQQIAQKQQELRDQLTKGNTDATALGKILLDVEALKKQITQAETSVAAQALAVLTADQKTKLKTLADAAKLQPTAMQATMLGLIDRPTPPAGGSQGGPGPRGMGMGMGAGMPMHQGPPPAQTSN